MNTQNRMDVITRLKQDLIGPYSEDESLSFLPTDVYLTGILFPQAEGISQDENEALSGTSSDSAESTDADAAPLDKTTRPASCGVSFATNAKEPQVSITVSYGMYVPEQEGENTRIWRRVPYIAKLDASLVHGARLWDSAELNTTGLNLYVQMANWSGGSLITIAAINALAGAKSDSKDDLAAKSLFQVEVKVEPLHNTMLIARPSRISGEDDDAKAARLLYRDASEFATGHTCSADWVEGLGRSATSVSTTWLPIQHVPSMDAKGHPSLSILDSGQLKPLSAKWLATADAADIRDALRLISNTYRSWIALKQSDEVPMDSKKQAAMHLTACSEAATRIDEAIDLLFSDSTAMTAFQLANSAMETQRVWTDENHGSLSWRPFQLAFILLSLPSLASCNHVDRRTMDLLWFPTGGGKTEAYLGLLAFVLFHRRLRNSSHPDHGSGVACLMRYTLRLLTTQQFERASALILACEGIRRTSNFLGETPFSAGLWVGGDSVPNDYKTAKENLASGDPNKPTPAQLTTCPSCKGRLKWLGDDTTSSILVQCVTPSCELAKWKSLPIWTLDSNVYRERPSLIIGTIDKFAQITRNPDSGVLFGDGTTDPPDLIIQDELHLISGPLGTIAGLYEVAIDHLSSQPRRGSGRSLTPPKLIGSTATIRRAEPQIRALFDRKTFQFPPAGLSASDSFFSVVDSAAAGRLYVGVTTAGRSAKFTLQAVCASLLQAADVLPRTSARDPYWTLVTYFNSLRELGGAVVLMQDDVSGSIEQYATARGEKPRAINEVRELTSRIPQAEVRELLDTLKATEGTPGCVDVLLASNMISVGVDIPRLGMMVVNGQPKGMSEYIQSTSRVGRGRLAGLIVSVYNTGKARDRSHFETFRTWHRTLYREVDATSVTPFASRARDRALHAALVALVRHLIPSMRSSPGYQPSHADEIESFIKLIAERANRASNGEEASGTEADLRELVAKWSTRPGLADYWSDFKLNQSLLVSAERAAELRACGRAPGEAWPTPNTMRNVEPSTPFQLKESLVSREERRAIREKAISGK